MGREAASGTLAALSGAVDTEEGMDMAQRRLPVTGLVVAVAALGSACAAAGPLTTGPTPFPGVSAPSWAVVSDAGRAVPVRDVLETAVSLRGSPYQFGGESPRDGFDCSGFVRYVFARHALDVPRTVAEQFQVGRKVDGAHVSAGDLVFFSTTGPGATHVGIVVDPEEQTFVHAPGTGAVVRMDRFSTPYWHGRLLGARRLTFPALPAS